MRPPLPPDRRPVITGVGVVSAFGPGARDFFDGLADGRSATGPIRTFDATTFPTTVAGEVPVGTITPGWLLEHLAALEVPPPGPHLPALLHRWYNTGVLRDRKTAFGLLAALEAWTQAGCGPAERDAALILALGLEQALLEDFAPIFARDRIDWSAEPAADLPRTRFRTGVDQCARAVGEALELRGPAIVNASACAGGALAVGHAADLVARGAASIVLCGAADSMVNPLGIGGLSRLGVTSPRNAPDACRPFDARRDGLVIGEGAAVFVVESEARALARGASPLARVLGWGSSQDAWRITSPRPDGSAAAEAMRQALRVAGLEPAALGYINAHGTGTPLNDPAEVRAIRAALGDAAGHVPVSSIKGAIGHLMAAAGALELAACLLPFARDLLPGTAHHGKRDPECDLDIIGETPRPARIDAALSNSFGFGGQNASVILGRWL